MKKLLVLFIGVATTLFMFSCGDGPKGFKKTDNGLLYKFHVQKKEGAKPAEGDMLTAILIYKTDKDSLLFDSHNNPGPFRIPLMKSEYKGDIYEGLGLMSEGDSATFIINADSFFLKTAQAPKVPDFILPNSNLTFHVKLEKIQKKDEYEKEQKELMEKQMKEMEGMKEKEQTELDKYLADNKITTKATESGLIYSDLKKGKGPKAKAGDKVTVEYRGLLLDGTEFDASAKHGKPFEFELGAGQVIPGWDEGISMMQKGGKAKMIIPSKIAYGSRGMGSIPPFSTLIFEVELLDIKSK